MRLIASVSDIGLFGFLAKKLPHLVIAACACVGGAFAYALWLSPFLEERSTHVGVNVGLIGLTFVLVLLASYVLTMLTCSLLFGERWRLHMLAGVHTTGPDDLSVVKDNSLLFWLILVGTFAGMYLGVSAATDNFVERYRVGGFYMVRLRSPDPAERIAVLRSTVDPVYEKATNYSPLRREISEALRDDDARVREWAAWVAGERLIHEAQPGLLTLLQVGSDAERIEAAIALGKLRDPAAEIRLISILPTVAQNVPLAQAVIIGLGQMNSVQAIPTMLALVGVVPPEVEAALMWALKRADHTDPLDPVLTRFKQETDLAKRCAAAEALKTSGALDVDRELRNIFSEQPPGQICEEVAWVGRTYMDEKRPVPLILVANEDLRFKLLVSIFNIAGPDLREWLVDIAWSETESDDMKVFADKLAEAIRKGNARPGRERIRALGEPLPSGRTR